MVGGIGGGKASKILILVFPEFLEALALSQMEFASGLGTTVRAKTGSRRVGETILLHIGPVRQHLHALKRSSLLVPQFLHASMISRSINDPTFAVDSAR
jgi:hypothetical protein